VKQPRGRKRCGWWCGCFGRLNGGVALAGFPGLLEGSGKRGSGAGCTE
jgi:hypothetical protein